MDATYLTKLDASSSATVIERVLSLHRYEISQRESIKHIHIICRSNQHWFRILVGTKTHLIHWSIQSNHSGTRVEFKLHYARWYATVLVFMVPLSLFFWHVTILRLLVSMPQGFESAIARLITFILTAASVFFIMALIIANGSQVTNRFVRAIRGEIRSHGFEFERHDSDTLSGHMKLAVLYMSLLLATAAAGIIRSELYVTHSPPLVAALIFGSLLTALLSVLLIAGRRLGASERCVMVLPAISTVAALDFLLGILIAPFIMGRVNYDQWSQAVEEHPDAVKIAAIMFVFFPAMAAMVIVRGLRSLQEIIHVESEIKARFDATRARATMAASGYLRILRAALVIIWITLTGPLVVVTTMTMFAFARWALIDTPSGPVAATSWIVASILDQEPANSSVIVITYVLWISLLLIILIPFTVSLGQFGWRMHRFRRWTKQSYQHRNYKLLNNVVHELASPAMIDPPRIIVRLGKVRNVSAQIIGFRRIDRVIVVGDECVELLDANELRALIAHETAHHLNGDCIRHFLLQFLARLTLMGDGFVAVLEHSFQYEENADRTAIQRFGIDPRHLASCIRKMSALTTLESLHKSRGLGFHDRTPREGKQKNTHRISLWSRFTESVRLWWQCYTCDTEMGYWHPSLSDRLALLNSMSTENISDHAQDTTDNA